MSRIVISIDPVIFTFGSLELRWYSLAILVAILVGVWVAEREYRRRDLAPTHFGGIAFYAIAGGILGARLLHIVDRLDYYADHPAHVLDFQSGGLAIYGAVLGGFAGVAVATRIYRVPMLPVIDAVAPALALAQAIGRLGCIVNGDAWGARTDWPLAFIYTNPDSFIPNQLLDVPTHPYPLYDMALNLAVFIVIWRMRRRALPSGMLFATFVTLYAAGRFVISWVREERVWFLGLQEAQVIALAALMAGVVALALLARRTGRPGGRLTQSPLPW